MSCTSLDDVDGLIRTLRPRTQLVNIDLKDTYRIVPVHPYGQYLLAVRWGRKVYGDLCLPFGLCLATKIFMAVADALAWALYCQGMRYFLHYLDNFLFIGAPDSPEAAIAASLATDVL